MYDVAMHAPDNIERFYYQVETIKILQSIPLVWVKGTAQAR